MLCKLSNNAASTGRDTRAINLGSEAAPAGADAPGGIKSMSALSGDGINPDGLLILAGDETCADGDEDLSCQALFFEDFFGLLPCFLSLVLGFSKFAAPLYCVDELPLDDDGLPTPAPERSRLEIEGLVRPPGGLEVLSVSFASYRFSWKGSDDEGYGTDAGTAYPEV